MDDKGRVIKNFFRFADTPALSANTGTEYREEYDRDYARVLHSPSFRRLQNKTQLFPGQESDFFRNRLTHSLEVSQIARSIANKLNKEIPYLDIQPRVCEIAGLVHDIGHPPFGHNGEAALDSCMCGYGGFEGNAQTFRILARLEKKEVPKDSITLSPAGEDQRVGLNLTARVLASALKYDCEISAVRVKNSPLVKGYYSSEKNIVEKLKECLCFDADQRVPFKTIECSIMDLADDIAYSTYDLEDAFKAGFLTPYDVVAADEKIYQQIVEKLDKSGIKADVEECRATLVGVFNTVWESSVNNQKTLIASNLSESKYYNDTISNFLTSYTTSKRIATDGYMRNKLTSGIVNSFINGIKVEVNKNNPLFSKVYFDDETLLRVNILKHFSYVALINSPRLKITETRGKEIISKMFHKLAGSGGDALLPDDTREMFHLSSEKLWQSRVICDFISGMTDRYALEFYGRLFSENPQSIFKPLY